MVKQTTMHILEVAFALFLVIIIALSLAYWIPQLREYFYFWTNIKHIGLLLCALVPFGVWAIPKIPITSQWYKIAIGFFSIGGAIGLAGVNTVGLFITGTVIWFIVFGIRNYHGGRERRKVRK